MTRSTTYKATPYLYNDVDVVYFNLLRDAVTYLNKYTGTTMTDIEWKAIGKIKSRKMYRGGSKALNEGYTPISLVGPGIAEKKIFDL